MRVSLRRSICNEVLCNSKDSVNDALAMKALMHKLDPMGNRPVSANQNGWVGAKTPLDVQVPNTHCDTHRVLPNHRSYRRSLFWADAAAVACDGVCSDVQGFDYSTQHYDSWHSATPGIPEISSETSSAVSDRGEYANTVACCQRTLRDQGAPGAADRGQPCS